MKLCIFAAVCLALVVLAASNDVHLGQRKPGDVLVASRRLFRLGVPGKPMVAQSGFNADGTITAVNAVNAPGSNANVTIVKGGPGEDRVVVAAISEPGAGLDVQLDIYALLATPAPPPA
ncbi:uncharacterized protein LOC123271790 [Cotesia glomerata]|uniref:Uncharacterized protein n=1 Tax=Cotesia glomerata TaxID=32391 RepID=A0AAV7IE57_COTGL|nr:uncharacterized protein LOC123271790 [Cotesia glomerata]KAH0558209.1 hypothetical protein KQX54_014886 [Cotesia glomerata]